jgi:Tfp pilus assembly protein PilO
MRRVANDTWIMLAVLAAIVGVFLVGIYTPQTRRMDRLQAQIAKDKHDLEASAELAAIVPSLIKKVNELRTQYSNFDVKLPREVDVGAFYREICANITREQLSMPHMKVQSPLREELYNTLPIVLQTQGSYLAVGKLLQRLDGMDRLTLVERLELNAMPRSPAVDVTLLVNIYHMANDSETGRNEQEERKQQPRPAPSPAL